MTSQPDQDPIDQPAYVTDLQAVYGPPSQVGFGSAVFHEPLPAAAALEPAAFEKYRHFVGDLWERFGEDGWKGAWKEVFARRPDSTADIIAELRGLEDFGAMLSASLVLDNVDEPEAGQAALAAAYDDPAVDELRVYAIGDGEAISGILIAGRRSRTLEGTYLVFLMD